MTRMGSGLGQPDGVVLSANRGGASMLRSPGLSAFAALGLAVLGGCTVSPNQARTLLSISVSPATAQDSGSTAGVQFTATGTFSTPPVSLSPLPDRKSTRLNSSHLGISY